MCVRDVCYFDNEPNEMMTNDTFTQLDGILNVWKLVYLYGFFFLCMNDMLCIVLWDEGCVLVHLLRQDEKGEQKRRC